MNTTFNLLFYIKKRANYVSGPVSISLRITVNGKRAELSIQRRCLPERWNSASGRMIGTKDDAREMNAYMDVIRSKAYEIHRELVQDRLPVSAEIIRNKLTGVEIVEEKPHMLLEVFAYHNKQFAELVGKEYSFGSLKKFTRVYKSLEKFIKEKYNENDLAITQLKYQFITEYEFYLKTVQHVAHNTAMGMIKKLRKIVRQCVDNDWLVKDPFSAYKMKFRETHRLILTSSELVELAEKEFSVGRLDLVRDLFVFNCLQAYPIQMLLN